MNFKLLSSGILLFMTSFSVWGNDPELHKLIPIHSKGTAAYYVDGYIDGFGPAQLLVDTGAGYTTINEEMLAVLKKRGQAKFVKKLSGILADGSRKVVPVYLIPGINIGGECMIRDVEAVIFPAKTRLILGMNTLLKVSPFTFSMDPPSLLLSNCGNSV